MLPVLREIHFVFRPLQYDCEPVDESAAETGSDGSHDCFVTEQWGCVFGAHLCGPLSQIARPIEFTGAVSFLIGTSMDLVISHLYLFREETYELAVWSFAVTMFRLVAGISYILLACIED